ADLYLERAVTGVGSGSLAVLELAAAGGPSYAVYKIRSITDASIAGFGMSSKSAGLKLTTPGGSPLNDNGTDKPAIYKVRKTTVLLQSERLTLADLPIVDLIEGDTVTLDGPYLGLKVGKRVILTGERADLTGVTASESLTLKEVKVEAGFTVVTFD